MKAIKFYELASDSLEFDGEKKDFRLHSPEQYNWGAKDENEYEQAEKEINAISYKGEGWEVYCWFDVSGWDYWMNQQEESNYIMTTVAFESDEVDSSQVEPINTAIDNALNDVLNISQQYSYMPELI